jgi:hypothetical protein
VCWRRDKTPEIEFKERGERYTGRTRAKAGLPSVIDLLSLETTKTWEHNRIG